MPVWICLTRTPLWLGPDLLPERLDPEHTAALERQARSQPRFEAAQLRSAQQAGGGARTVADKSAVLGVAADWLEACAPSQQQQVEALRGAATKRHW